MISFRRQQPEKPQVHRCMHQELHIELRAMLFLRGGHFITTSALHEGFTMGAWLVLGRVFGLDGHQWAVSRGTPMNPYIYMVYRILEMLGILYTYIKISSIQKGSRGSCVSRPWRVYYRGRGHGLR